MASTKKTPRLLVFCLAVSILAGVMAFTATQYYKRYVINKEYFIEYSNPEIDVLPANTISMPKKPFIDFTTKTKEWRDEYDRRRDKVFRATAEAETLRSKAGGESVAYMRAQATRMQLAQNIVAWMHGLERIETRGEMLERTDEYLYVQVHSPNTGKHTPLFTADGLPLVLLKDVAEFYNQLDCIFRTVVKGGLPILTSGLRPNDKQLEMRQNDLGAANIEGDSASLHPTGAAFDLWYGGMTAEDLAACLTVLEKLQQLGVIYFIDETGRDVWHTMLVWPGFTGLDQRYFVRSYSVTEQNNPWYGIYKDILNINGPEDYFRTNCEVIWRVMEKELPLLTRNKPPVGQKKRGAYHPLDEFHYASPYGFKIWPRASVAEFEEENRKTARAHWAWCWLDRQIQHQLNPAREAKLAD